MKSSTRTAGDGTWREAALCAQTDPEAFYPDKGGSTREALAVCRRCPVQGPCLEYALVHDERFGIWGGTTERQRRRLRREGAEAAAAAFTDPVPAAAAVGG